eukprot:3699-Heterococcus_DN1.PRE.3
MACCRHASRLEAASDLYACYHSAVNAKPNTNELHWSTVTFALEKPLKPDQATAGAVGATSSTSPLEAVLMPPSTIYNNNAAHDEEAGEIQYISRVKR